MENTNDTRRLDHIGGFPGVGVAPDGPQAHHRCFRGRPQSCPPPPLYLLPIASRIRNKRNGAGLAPATTAAHQHSMGDDPPNSGEPDGRQSSGRDLGAPGAVGLAVTHPGVKETGPTLNHLRQPLQRSRWPTGTGPELAHTSVPAGRNPSGRHYKEHQVYLYKSGELNLTPDKRKRLYSDVFGSQLSAPWFRAKKQVLRA